MIIKRHLQFTMSTRFFLTFKRHAKMERAILIDNQCCLLPSFSISKASEYFFKTTVKLYQLFLPAVQFICKKVIFNRFRRITLVKFA